MIPPRIDTFAETDTVTRLECEDFVIDLRPEWGDINIWSQYSKEAIVIKESQLGALLGMLDRAAKHYAPKGAANA